MSDLDRFTAFLLRHAASYHAPPETPAAAMWEEIERTLRTADDAAGPAGVPIAYHEPPEPPREAMWTRIEAAWSLRRSAPAGAREAGLEALERLEMGEAPRRERRKVTLWLTGLAAAASLLIGIALGRGTILLGGGEAGVAIAPPDPATAVPETGDPSGREGPSALEDSGGFDAADDAALEPLETSARLAGAAGVPRAEAGDAPANRSEAASDDRSRTPADRRRFVAQVATAEHLGRAATLLTAFRSDADAGGEDDLAVWARELLGETRLLLDMSVERSPRDRALLEEVELLLAQIARLGTGAPGFERDLITEGLDRGGTLTRLRSASAAVGT